MTMPNPSQPTQAHSEETSIPLQTPRGLDPRERILVLGLEIAKRASAVKSTDELHFLLVNDLRALIEFDRCFLVTHYDGLSTFIAANNQPTLDNKSKLYVHVSDLAPHLKVLDKAILLSNEPGDIDFPPSGLGEEVKTAVSSYLNYSDCKYFVCIPLLRNEVPLAHLILEFFDKKVPAQFEILGLINVAPLLAAALHAHWLAARDPETASLVEAYSIVKRQVFAFFRAHWKRVAQVAAVFLGVLFLLPQYYTVGGEAEIAPWERRTAFCKLDGLIEKVLVSEGSSVQDHQVLAVLDRKDQDYAIETAQREVEILTKQAKLLSLESDETPSKLAERQVIELERKKRHTELEYRKWQAQFLGIIAPVAGVVLTKDVESLAGKKMKAGEAFCEIAVPGELAAEIYVPEDKATLVQKGQEAYLYLNNNPGKALKLEVAEVSPAAEVVQRLGSVCRVRAKFVSVPSGTKVGMKGVGKIYTVRSNLWSIVAHGFLIRWNKLSLYL